VSAKGRTCRSTSTAPSAVSRFDSCWLVAETLAPSRRAAAEIDRSSAMAAKTSMPQSVTFPGVSTIAVPPSRAPHCAALQHG
jgi:hypothetical protein